MRLDGDKRMMGRSQVGKGIDGDDKRPQPAFHEATP